MERWQPEIDLSRSAPDIVLLAGDIDSNPPCAVNWAAETFDPLPVLYVHGNHEGYGHKLDHIVAKISAACDATNNVHYLNRAEYIHQGVRFLGATLWTDFALFGEDKREACMARAHEVMSDYHRIRLASAGYRKVTPADTAGFHKRDRGLFEEKLNQTFAGPTVAMTHMAPSFKSVPVQYASDLASAAYASNLDELVAKAGARGERDGAVSELFTAWTAASEAVANRTVQAVQSAK